MSENERYTHGHHESVLRSHSWRTVENSSAYLIPHLTPGVHVLDVGSGPGTITLDIARLVAPGSVVGIDLSEKAGDKARALAADTGISNVHFALDDVYSLESEDNAFDVVHIHQVLQHLNNPIAALREVRRVLKPGGVLGVREVDYGGTIWAPPLPGLSRWYRTYDAVHRMNGGDPDAGRSLKRWVMDAGFDNIDSTASIWCFSSDADREWWGTSWAERATESDFAVTAIESGLATADDLRKISEAWQLWAQAKDGWLAMPHAEVVARA